MVLIRTILGGFLHEVGGAVRSTVETALVATGKVYGIYIAIFAQSIGEVPKCFGVAGRDDAKAVISCARKGLSLYFAM